MQGLHTHIAMRHAELPLDLVWDHFLNMGGIIGFVELDAYLHGLLTLPDADRDCVAQAVNELLDDLAMTGRAGCCRAPYSGDRCLVDEQAVSLPAPCVASGHRRTAGDLPAVPPSTAGRRAPRLLPPQPTRGALHRER